MVEAYSVYKALGNLVAQTPTTFNIGNIHFTRQRWNEAISSYSESLALIDKQIEDLGISRPAQ
jgi:hypothetical protein